MNKRSHSTMLSSVYKGDKHDERDEAQSFCCSRDFPTYSNTCTLYDKREGFVKHKNALSKNTMSIFMRHADLTRLLDAAREVQQSAKQIWSLTGEKWTSVQCIPNNKLTVVQLLKLSATMFNRVKLNPAVRAKLVPRGVDPSIDATIRESYAILRQEVVDMRSHVESVNKQREEARLLLEIQRKEEATRILFAPADHRKNQRSGLVDTSWDSLLTGDDSNNNNNNELQNLFLEKESNNEDLHERPLKLRRTTSFEFGKSLGLWK
jgi:hypothetical protein